LGIDPGGVTAVYGPDRLAGGTGAKPKALFLVVDHFSLGQTRRMAIAREPLLFSLAMRLQLAYETHMSSGAEETPICPPAKSFSDRLEPTRPLLKRR